MDIMQQGNYNFIGDTALERDNYAQNFHIKPARIYYRAYNRSPGQNSFGLGGVIIVNNKTFIVLDRAIANKNITGKIKTDALIISRNPKIYMDDVAAIFDCDEIIFDSSNPAWKIAKWKKDCERLHLRFYSVAEQGAYVAAL